MCSLMQPIWSEQRFLLAHAACFPDAGDQRHLRMDFINGLMTPLRRSYANRPACDYCGREALRRIDAAQWQQHSPARSGAPI